MISVIVPVYNVVPYLRKCLDSIVGQTYRDLEVLVIDDGSTDGSGKICDEYRRDERIKVFHTENRGLSSARNLGLDESQGEWIGFVDSDDWIEPDMYECLMDRALETGADVVECGYIKEYLSSNERISAKEELLYGNKAVKALIMGKFHGMVWNKIWKKDLFNNVFFPSGQAFEDVATTYRLLANATVTGISTYSYHYLKRSSGITQCHNTQNLVDYWKSHKDRYDNLVDLVDDETRIKLLRFCALAISRTWVWYIRCNESSEKITEMSGFAREKMHTAIIRGWPFSLRMCIYLAKHDRAWSFTIAYISNQIYRLLKPKFYA